MAGTGLVRRYRGKDVVVRVREDGFEYSGQIHRSLSSAVRSRRLVTILPEEPNSYKRLNREIARFKHSGDCVTSVAS